ncbi:NAD(P)-binding protein [Zopfia rhizophila CBS 207.26]|uniref:NAD(P)-binding protein n=1 Tax=Zopfia rhizophila CBS 207.26 TaxID=1314779 RepID=A0A6A6EBA4_9PEZI|nr:NAD(P)-binding protein [Zopfia rhizophila CBS 207.26]
MSPARVGVEDGAGQQPSHKAIDNGNLTIFKPKWLVLDDLNIDLISFVMVLATSTSILFFDLPARIAIPAAAALILPLRLFLPRPKTLQGLVLITGASSGIGAELSYIFAEKGHDLILVGRDEEQLEAVKNNVEKKYGKTVYTISTDLSLPGAAKQLYYHVTKEGFTVDVLVNGAALGGAGDTLEQPIELTERMTTLNCTSLAQLTQLFGRDMIKRGRGWMLQISSVGGWMASPGQNIYHATKHYVRSFSEALSIELRAYPGIVNTQLMPGPVHTQFVTRAHAKERFIMGASGAVEDPKAVATAGYNGLCKGKSMVFSSWNAAFTSLLMQVAPRSVRLTVASLMNAPLRGKARVKEPEKDQNVRGEDLKGRRGDEAE